MMMMATEGFGLKATGICLEPYFIHGVPSSLDAVIRNIDSELLENNNQLEQCVKDLMEMSQQLSSVENAFDGPVEAVNNVMDNLLLEKTTCFDVDLDTVSQMLRNVIKFVESHPGSEESVLHDLLNLYSSQGLAFPVCASSTSLVSQSTLSLHTAVDQSEQVVESLWNDLCLRLRHHFVDYLCRLPTGQPLAPIDTVRQQRLHHIQSLCSIFPTPSVFAKYRSLRQHQLQMCLNKGSRKKEKFSDLVKSFIQTSKNLLVMIEEDFDLFLSGVFADEMDALKGIGEIYFDALGDHISSIIDTFYCELPSPDKKNDKDTKAMPKSPSDGGFLGRHLRGGLKHQHSQSLESLVMKGDEKQFTDLSLIPEMVLSSLVEFVECLLFIDSRLEIILSLSTWELIGSNSTKKTSQKKLKSALKNTLVSPPEEPDKVLRNGKIPSTSGDPCISEELEMFDGDATVSGVRPLVQVRLPSSDGPQFDWRGILQRLNPDLGLCLRSHLHRLVEKACKEESDVFEKTSTLPKFPLPSEFIGCHPDLPRIVSKATWNVLNEISRLLPLALSGDANVCNSVIGISFLDAVAHSAQTLNAWLLKLSHESADRVLASSLYIGLASSTFLQNRLECFESALRLSEESSHPGLTSRRDECQATTGCFVETIKQLHKDLISHSISRDAQSHNWNDAKEFFEGERCSFDIQMWNLHMQQLRFDLWSISSTIHAKAIFRNVLSESLFLFAWRYSRIQPSHRRLQQFTADISAILLCTSELLLSSCDSVSQLLDPSNESVDIAAVHDTCISLLSTLAVVGPPLEFIYRFYRKGFDKRTSRPEENGCAIKGYRTQWLSWIRPTLLPLGKTSLDSLPTSSAVYLHLSLMSRQPQVTWHHLLQALVMKDYQIPIMLLTSLNEMAVGPIASGQKEEVVGVVGQLFMAFIDIFVKCNQFPDGLTRVILPVIERSNGWSLFDTSTVIGKTTPIPVWLMALIKQLKTFTDRVLEPAIRLLLIKLNAAPLSATPLSDFLKDQLPCGCHPLRAPAGDFKSNVKDLVAECMYSVITQIVSDIHSVPVPLAILFRSVQEELIRKGSSRTSRFHTVGLKVLATALKLALTDLDEVSRMTGCSSMEQNMKDNLIMLAECIYHILSSPSCDRGSGAPRIAGLFMKANKSWLSEQIEVITDHLASKEASELSSNNSSSHLLEGTASSEYVSQLLLTQCQSVLTSKTGTHSLSLVNSFISSNSLWIVSQLDATDIFREDYLLSSIAHSSPSLVLALTTTRNEEDFNPLQSYTRIGNFPFDQSVLMNYKFDWASLVSADFGLGAVAFRSLLQNRPDIRDSDLLEDLSARRMAEALKKKYLKHQTSK